MLRSEVQILLGAPLQIVIMSFSGNISAIILAAGYSSRMGRFKPMALLGESTAVELCVRLFRSSGIDDVCVVTGHRHDELSGLIGSIGVRLQINRNFDEGMFSSIKAGVSSLGPGVKAFFVLPVDIPLVRKYTVIRLLEEFRSGPVDVIYPCFKGRRGHPPLINGELISGIKGFDGDGGLRGFLKGRLATDVEVADENILRDMDTDEQYRLMLERLKDHAIPSRQECMSFLRHVVHASEPFTTSAGRLARINELISEAMKRNGKGINPKLTTALSCLLGLTEDPAIRESIPETIRRQFGDSALFRIIQSTVVGGCPPANVGPELEVVSIGRRILGETDVDLRERLLLDYGLDSDSVSAVKSLINIHQDVE